MRGAALDGVARELDPGEATMVDPGHMSAGDRDARGIARFPTDLNEALDALQRDEVLMDALGPDLARSYLAVKRSEVAAFAEEDLDVEIRHHIGKF